MIFKNLQKGLRSLINYYFLLVSFLVAVFLTNIFEYSFIYVFLFLLILLLNCICWFNKYREILIFLIIWLSIWFLLSIINQNNISNNYLLLNKTTFNYSNTVLVKWEILENYKNTEFNNSFIFNIHSINDKNLTNNINLLVKTPTNTTFYKWDIIEFNSKIKKIDNFNEFEYDKYMLLKKIYWQTNIYQYVKKWNTLNYFESKIENFKLGFLKVINQIYPWDSAKLLAWIFLGVRGNYSKELAGSFSSSWLSHIVAVSWYNITILIIFIWIFFKTFPSFIRNILTIGVIIFFLLLIGNNVPAWRAWIMGIIWYLAVNKWRNINIYSLLIFVATLFVIQNPLMINYDISFHLSFLALLWLVSIVKDVSSALYFLPSKFQIKESIATTLAVLIFTLPIMLVNFEKISIISPISNLLVLPVIPLSMLFWGLSIIGFVMYSKIGIYLGFVTFLLLKYVLIIATFLWDLSFATVGFDLWNFKDIFTVFYYFILCLIILYNTLNKKEELLV